MILLKAQSVEQNLKQRQTNEILQPGKERRMRSLVGCDVQLEIEWSKEAQRPNEIALPKDEAEFSPPSK